MRFATKRRCISADTRYWSAENTTILPDATVGVPVFFRDNINSHRYVTRTVAILYHLSSYETTYTFAFMLVKSVADIHDEFLFCSLCRIISI